MEKQDAVEKSRLSQVSYIPAAQRRHRVTLDVCGRNLFISFQITHNTHTRNTPGAARQQFSGAKTSTRTAKRAAVPDLVHTEGRSI